MNADKKTILDAIGDIIAKMLEPKLFYVYFCGPATVREAAERQEAGKWCCADGAYIAVDEVLQVIHDRTPSNRLMVCIISDCPGAAGAYHRLVARLNAGWTISDRIHRVKLDFACDFDEVPFADDRGSIYPRQVYVDTQLDILTTYRSGFMIGGLHL